MLDPGLGAEHDRFRLLSGRRVPGEAAGRRDEGHMVGSCCGCDGGRCVRLAGDLLIGAICNLANHRQKGSFRGRDWTRACPLSGSLLAQFLRRERRRLVAKHAVPLGHIDPSSSTQSYALFRRSGVGNSHRLRASGRAACAAEQDSRESDRDEQSASHNASVVGTLAGVNLSPVFRQRPLPAPSTGPLNRGVGRPTGQAGPCAPRADLRAFRQNRQN